MVARIQVDQVIGKRYLICGILGGVLYEVRYDADEASATIRDEDYKRLQKALGLGGDLEPAQEPKAGPGGSPDRKQFLERVGERFGKTNLVSTQAAVENMASELHGIWDDIGLTAGESVREWVQKLIRERRELGKERDSLAEEVKVRVQERDSVRGKLAEANQLPMEVERLDKLLERAHESEELVAQALDCPEDTDLVDWAKSCKKSMDKCGVWEPAMVEALERLGVEWDVSLSDEQATEQLLASANKNRENLDAIIDNSRGLIRALNTLGVDPAHKKSPDIEKEAQAKANEHNRTKLLAQAVERYLDPKQEDEQEGSKYE
jgi:hypothetical protein